MIYLCKDVLSYALLLVSLDANAERLCQKPLEIQAELYQQHIFVPMSLLTLLRCSVGF